MPDQTYLQHAQPSTFGHYLLSFAYPVLRDARRLVDALAWINTSPGGAGCVNGQPVARRPRAGGPDCSASTASSSTRATPCGRPTASCDVLAAAASLVGTQSKLAEDLEIWASSEFDYVTIADGYSRSQRAHAAEAQPVRAVDHPGGVAAR